MIFALVFLAGVAAATFWAICVVFTVAEIREYSRRRRGGMTRKQALLAPSEWAQTSRKSNSP
jgi:hypothetical protein